MESMRTCNFAPFLEDLSLIVDEKVAGRKLLTVPRPGPPKASHRWIALPVGLCKINVDTGLVASGNPGACAAIFRDETGKFLGASSISLKGLSDPTAAEAIACNEGLSLAQDLQLARFVLASDCSNVINDLKTRSLGY